MKKVILFAAILFAGVSVAKADETPVETATSTLNVNLYGFQELIVNGTDGGDVVNLDYRTAAEYKAGVTAKKPNHLIVSSAGGFNITVQSSGNLTTEHESEAGKIIAASSIKITSEEGDANPLTGAVSTTVEALSTAPQSLITSTKGGVNKTFDISYTGAGSDKYIKNYISGESPTIYTTTVTYTLTAK